MNYQINDLYQEGYDDAIAGLSYPMFRREKDNPQYRAGYQAGQLKRQAKPAIAWTDATLIAEGYCR